MDDLRIALLIIGIVAVAAVYALARLSRRKAARRSDEHRVARESRDETENGTDESDAFEPRALGDGAGTEADVGRLGGLFVANREVSDAELSVDVNILAGLRATYESTLDGSPDESVRPEPFVSGDAAQADAQTDADAGAAEPSVGTVGTVGGEPVAVDMTRPLVYLTLVAKQGQVSGRAVLDALDAEGFRPGMLQLFYWCSDAEPSVRYGVANMVEPGILDPDALPDTEMPGLVTFMSVPEDSASAFRILDAMVAGSRRLARRLEATLCDETRSTLTAQAENHLRETIAEILRRELT